MCHVLLKVGARVSTAFPQATAVAAASLYQGFGSRAVRVYISVDGIYLCNLWTSICNVCVCVDDSTPGLFTAIVEFHISN